MGWPRLCHRALARSCLVAGRDGRCPWCPAVSPTHTGCPWKNKLLPSLVHTAGSRSGGSGGLGPEGKARRTWNFSQSACTFPTRASPCPRTTLCVGSSVISVRREHLLQSGSEQSSQALISLKIVLWRLLLLSNRDLGSLKLAVVARGCPCHPHLLPGALGAGLSVSARVTFAWSLGG